MNILRGYRTELDPNNVQRTLLLKTAGAARFAYNWGLNRKQEVYAMNQLPVPHIKNPTAIDLHRELNRLKKTDFPWFYEVSKCAPQEALRTLDKAFDRFFKGLGKYPKFKSKKKGIGSFTITTGTMKVSSDHIEIPKVGNVRLKERNYIPTDLEVRSMTVSEKAGRWFVSVLVKEETGEPVPIVGPVAGTDVGSMKLATVSDGRVFENPRALRRNERKKARLQRSLTRKKKGSKNRRKARMKVSRIDARIANIRRNAIHELTTYLAKTKSVNVIETLNVNGMLKNHNLAKSIADAALGEFGRQMVYKCKWYGSLLFKADPFYPSSKRCSGCGHVKDDFPLDERIYICEVCGLVIDRDLNAARNLEQYYTKNLGPNYALTVAASSTETINACQRREVAGPRETGGQCSPVKQELNTIGKKS
jgi:putative transposase